MQARIFEYLSCKNDTEIIVVDNAKSALSAQSVASFLGFESFVLPDFRAQKNDDLRAFNNELFEISATLSSYYKSKNPKKLIISPIRTLLNPLPSQKNLQTKTINLGDKISYEELKLNLINFGYEIVDIVQEKGEARISGDIIDIFSISDDEPVRILLDFDEINSIKKFNPATQKSYQIEYDKVEITPFLSALSQKEFDELNDKISSFQSDALIKDINAFGFWLIAGFENYLIKFKCILAENINKNEFDDNQDLSILDTIALMPEPKIWQDLQISISPSFFTLHKNKKITILSSTQSSFDALNLGKFNNINLNLSPYIVNLISDDEIIISLNQFSKKTKHKKASLVIDELNIGDFVVHEDYGIGKFNGLELITVLGYKREFVTIIYQNNDKLLLPTEHLNKIDRYIAGSGAIVSLDRLGKASFSKLKEKVREKLFAIANSIISTAAKRELINAIKFNLDKDYEKFRFEAGFVYTDDQEKAVSEICFDLQSGKVMDRLLSGDVGFGKTEVAMNAVYMCVKSGFQAFFFVPTTLLSSQHYATLKNRLNSFGIAVFRYDRFSSTKEKSDLKKAITDKKPFVVVGTHALLGLEPSNLGLIIIDEEHKFGVKQKEKLKQISQNSHILAMSATPIPRSLNMALSKVKSYSVLMTPPLDRLDIRSFVKIYDENLIKEAILREIRRKGQVFYVHNLISDIQMVAKDLQSLIPNIKILILHSKIDAKTTEDEVMKFANGYYDVLLCTSIVESGIHLPNVNTIIIDSANKFGMADLHQLRGRVGRSNRQGYCYFLVDDENLSDNAKKRLVALESNSFLGSGAVLAYHDLEIRGGGNLLGIDQSGHIEAIGYSLYLKMLEDEINRLLNQKSEQKELEIKLNINAFLNSELINEDRLRLELYRRLSKCESVNEVYEIGSEIEDRFGRLDVYTKQFLDLIIIKILAINKDFVLISNFEQNISLRKANGESLILKSPSKDSDDIIASLLEFLRKK